MQNESSLYKRISLEFLSAFPGQVYLRFEPRGKTPATMVQVMPGDIVAISQLGDPTPEGGRVTAVEADEPEPTSDRLPDASLADDDFQQGDSG